MRSRGVPDQVTAAWHGHDETIMRKVYTHVTEEDLRAAHDQNVTRQRRAAIFFTQSAMGARQEAR